MGLTRWKNAVCLRRGPANGWSLSCGTSLSAVVQNVPGVLAHISGMLASRGYNIDSLAVGETENPDLSRMTFVVVGDDNVLEQVRKQLEKVVTVVRVVDISSQDFVERDLMLIKVRAPLGGRRSEIRELAEIFRGRIVDVAAEEVIVEISGQEHKIESFIDLMRPFGIVELVRTGRIAMVRGQRLAAEAVAESTEYTDLVKLRPHHRRASTWRPRVRQSPRRANPT